MKSLSINLKLGILVALLTGMMVAVGALSLGAMTGLETRLKSVNDDRVSGLVSLTRALNNAMKVRRRLDEVGLMAAKGQKAGNLEEIDDYLAAIDSRWADYLMTHMTPDERLL